MSVSPDLQEPLLTPQSEGSDENLQRRALARIDHAITPYQLEKLRLLACSILSVTSVDSVPDSGKASGIYNLLTAHYGGDIEASASALHAMLKSCGLEPELLKQLSSESNELSSDRQFEWRRSLIEYSDRAERQGDVDVVVNHLYLQTPKIRIDRESVTSLIVLFNHMIEINELGFDKEEVIKRALTRSKSMTSNISIS